MDHLSALSAFVKTAEARSFTVAARQLGLSASAVGKAVARLEERLEVRLFHRSTRSISLTPEGTLFLERCRRIFSEVEAAELELSQLRGAPRGRLRVSLPLVGALFVPTLCDFMREYPAIELDLDFSDRLVAVIEEGFDAVIRSGEPSDSRLMSRMLGTTAFCIAASPAYLARRGAPQTPWDLAEHSCLHYRYPGTGRLDPWPLRGDKAEARLPETAIATTLDSLIAMAERGLGLVCLPDFTIGPQLATGRLVTVLDGQVDRTGSIRILWPSSRHLSPKLRIFVDFMVQRLLPGGGAVAKP